MTTYRTHNEPVLIWTGRAMLDGRLTVPEDAAALVVLAGLADTAHDASTRHTTMLLQNEGLATLTVDLLTADERQFDSRTGHFRHDVVMLGDRIRDVLRWLPRVATTRDLPVMLFTSGTIAAAAMIVAATYRHDFEALMLVSARTDLAGESIRRVKAPTLFVVPDGDLPLLRATRDAESEMTTEVKVVVVPDDASDATARAAATWALVHAPAYA